ncbi:MAG: M28 family metallopeptidase [Bacteroidales bacterium]
MRILFFLIILFASCKAMLSQEQITVEISTDRLKRDVFFLASDSLEGRKFPGKGRKIAAQYIADEFQKHGLKPINTDTESYFQPIPVNHVDNGYTAVNVGSGFVPSGYLYSFVSSKPYSDSLELPIRFWGESNPKNQNIGDTIVHIYREDTDEAINSVNVIRKNTDAEFFAISLPKSETKRIIRNEWFSTGYIYPDRLKSNRFSSGLWLYDYLEDIEEDVRLLLFNSKTFETLYNKKPKRANRIAKRKIRKGEPALTSSIIINSNFNVTEEQMWDENVIGYIEGTDLKDEYIIICGHYDHTGKRGDDIFNGADDNASGTAGVMELARMCASAVKNGYEFKRSLVFVAFAAEETGLNGSTYYADNPVFPLDKTALVVNMDMIGRSDKGQEYAGHVNSWPIGGNKRKIRRVLRSVDKQIDETHFYLRKKFPENIMWFAGSDHYPFLRKGVPALVVSTGMHPDYHKPTDTAEKINFGNMANVIKGLFVLLTEVASNPNDFPLLNK